VDKLDLRDSKVHKVIEVIKEALENKDLMVNRVLPDKSVAQVRTVAQEMPETRVKKDQLDLLGLLDQPDKEEKWDPKENKEKWVLLVSKDLEVK